MPTLDRIRTAVRSPLRTRLRAALTLLVLAAAGYLAWYEWRLYSFHRDKAAAEQALAQYDFPAALDRLRECIRFRPRDPAVRLLAVQAARREELYAEAETHLTQYREAAGSTAAGSREGTILRVAQGAGDEDVRELLPLIESDHPATEQILEALALGSVVSYRIEHQGLFVGELLKRFPKNPVGRLLRAQLFVVGARHERAAEECRAILEDYPHFLKAKLLLAGVLLKGRKYAEGVAVYEELRRMRPDDFEVLLGLARCLDRGGRVEEARPLMRELEDQHADKSEALLECGRFAIKDGRLADAERLLRRAVEIAPNDHDVRFQLSVCLEQLGREEEARVQLAEFKRIEAAMLRIEQLHTEIVKTPLDPAPRREIGLICLRLGQNQEGLRWLSGVLQIAPNDRLTHAALADYFDSKGDERQALYHRLRSR